MGCIVNGPGEMADADFGYVGGAPGKIDLYVGKEVVRRGIAMDGATDELIELIKVCCSARGTSMLVWEQKNACSTQACATEPVLPRCLLFCLAMVSGWRHPALQAPFLR